VYWQIVGNDGRRRIDWADVKSTVSLSVSKAGKWAMVEAVALGVGHTRNGVIIPAKVTSFNRRFKASKNFNFCFE
jgi:hypothetical protein